MMLDAKYQNISDQIDIKYADQPAQKAAAHTQLDNIYNALLVYCGIVNQL